MDAAADPLCAVVVDDNHDAAASLSALLAVLQCPADYVTDPRKAIEAVARRRPRLVFLDLSMPYLSGHEVAHSLRRRFPGAHLIIIGISAWGNDPLQQIRAMQSGFDLLLAKPLDPGRLPAILEALARRPAR